MFVRRLVPCFALFVLGLLLAGAPAQADTVWDSPLHAFCNSRVTSMDTTGHLPLPPPTLAHSDTQTAVLMRCAETVTAVDYASGTVLWDTSHTGDGFTPQGVTQTALAAPLVAAPDGSAFYVCSEDGYFRAFDPFTGGLLSTQMHPDEYACWGSVAYAAAPSADFGPGDLIYVLYRPGSILAYSTNPLGRRWRIDLVDLGFDGLDTLPPSLAVSPYQEVYVVLGETLYAVSPYGDLLWSTPVPNGRHVAWVPEQDLLLVTGADTYSLVDPADGTIQFTTSIITNPAVRCDGPPSVLGSQLAFLTCENADAPSGPAQTLALSLGLSDPAWTADTTLYHDATHLNLSSYPPVVLPDGTAVCFPNGGLLQCAAVSDGTVLFEYNPAAGDLDPDYIELGSPLLLTDTSAGALSVFAMNEAGSSGKTLLRYDLSIFPYTAFPATYAGNTAATAQHSGQVATGTTGLVPVTGTATTYDAYTRPHPLAGATVTLETPGETLSTTTDDTGRFWFTRVLPGDATLTVSRTGYVTQTTSLTIEPNVPLDLSLDTIAPLMASFDVTTVDANQDPLPNVLITLIAQNTPGLQFQDTTRSPTGHLLFNIFPEIYAITASLDGYQPVTETRELVGGETYSVTYTLELLPGDIDVTVVESPSSTAIAGATVTLDGTTTATTDAQGVATFSDVTAGSHTLTVQADRYASSGTTTVTVEPDATSTVTISLAPAPGDIVVTILDQATSDPVGGATVVLDDTTTATTDAQGVATFSDVTAGTHTLAAHADGYATSVSVSVTVTPTETTTQAIALTPVVRKGSLSGTVVDGTGSALSGATVTLTASGASTPIASVSTDAAGAFSFSDLDPNTYTVSAAADGFLPQSTSVSLQEGEDKTGITLALTPASTSTKTIAGTVTDPDGTPIPNARVWLTRTDTDAIVATTFTDAQGAFTFSNLDPDLGYALWVQATAASDPQTQPLDLSEPDDDISLDPVAVDPDVPTEIRGTIRAIVLDDSGNPVQGAAVTPVLDPDFDGAPVLAPQTTGTDGRASFTDLLPWTYTIYAEADGYEQQTFPSAVLSPIDEAPEAEVTVTLKKLPPPSSGGGGGGGGGGCFLQTLWR